MVFRARFPFIFTVGLSFCCNRPITGHTLTDIRLLWLSVDREVTGFPAGKQL